MTQPLRPIDLIDEALQYGVDRGAAQYILDDTTLDGRIVQLSGKTLINFTSCSYLGLELDARLRESAIRAIERWGVQFSCSRAYVSAPGYRELEELLDSIFAGHTIVTPNTTLAHFCALPVLIAPEDAVIMDQCVHQSVQMAASLLRLQGTPIQVLRHGQMDQLEDAIKKLSSGHRRVHFLCDGVYSMFGDVVSIPALTWLLERHPALHLYVDDAHGVGWTGRHGSGVAAEHFAGHDRVAIAVSLNKGFGAGGGAIVLPNVETHRRVRNSALPLIFTGPVQPPILAAAAASARIHLSPEIDTLQSELMERIRLTNRVARELELPLARTTDVPIRFIGVSAKESMYVLFEALRAEGFLLNCASFPAVNSRQSGLRFTVTRHQRPEDIVAMLEAVARNLPAALAAGGLTRGDVERAFKLAPGPTSRRQPSRADDEDGDKLSVEHTSRIEQLDASDWNRAFAERGHDVATLAALEDVFGEGSPTDEGWRFHYFRVSDLQGRTLASTFFTEALWKDDVLAAARVSRMVESRRRLDPTFLTSRTLAMGSLITDGNHLYLDRSLDWPEALDSVLSAAETVREACGSPALVLRDLPTDDPELHAFLSRQGFTRLTVPDSQIITDEWSDREEFLASLTSRERRFHRKYVLPFDTCWEREMVVHGGRTPGDEEWAHWHRLYRNVQQRQLAINTFPLPVTLMPRLLETPGWELLLLRPPGSAADDPTAACGLALCQLRGDTYAPMVSGMDYEWVESHGLYRQLLSHCVERARELGAKHVDFGVGSDLEKRRFGARPVGRAMYVQSHDRYHQDVLELMAADAHLEQED